MRKFFEGLSYPQFIKALSTASGKVVKETVMELELGKSSSPKNMRRLYDVIKSPGRMKTELIDYLVKSVFIRRLPGNRIDMHPKYLGIFTGILDNFKVPHEEGFISEEEKKKAVKRLKKIKTAQLNKYLEKNMAEEKALEYLLVLRFFLYDWDLPAFGEVIKKNLILKSLIED
jgi:hypothetical protein